MLPSILLALVAAATTAAAAATTNLAPIRRSHTSLHHRSTSVLIPQYSPVLYFVEDSPTSSHIYTADLTLHAHLHQPIVVLQEIEELTAAITCNAAGIEIIFHSVAVAVEAAEVWRVYEKLVVVASNPGCAPAGESRPFIVNTINPLNQQTLYLQTTPASWETVAKKISVSLDHHYQELRKRGASDSGEAWLNSTAVIPGRVSLSPPTLDTGTIQANIQATCVNCSVHGKFLVKAAFDVSTDFDAIFNGHFGVLSVDTALIEIEALTEFRARAELEIVLGAGVSREFAASVLPKGPVSLVPLFNLAGVLTVGPMFDFEIALGLSGPSGSVNFTYGGEMVVPQGAKARLGLSSGRNDTKTMASGWNETDTTSIPLNLNSLDGELSFGANITTRPKFTFGVSLGKKVVELDAGFQMDLPKLYAKAVAVKNVTSVCTPPPPDIFTYYPSAVHLTTGVALGVQAIAGFSVSKTITNKGPWSSLLSSAGLTVPLWGREYPMKDWCLGYDKEILGALYDIASEDPVLDLQKVLGAIKRTGKVPKGVNATMFPELAAAVAELGSSKPGAGGKATQAETKKGGAVGGRGRGEATVAGLVVAGLVVVLW